MKLSRSWMSDYVDLGGLSDDEIGGRMTDIGHALDARERDGDDAIFDVEITTNRVDAMSHFGMARELAGALGRELKSVSGAGSFAAPRRSAAPPAQDDGASDGAPALSRSDVTIRIDAPEMCSRYTGLVIRGVTIRPSPAHIQQRLEAIGLRPINNVVDVTNYVMMTLGHPLHAFDLDKLTDKTIIVRPGKPGERMKSLDGETRLIDPETIVIADSRRAVALGGIIGGEESEIGGSTRDVLLECAWFDPSFIRRTARRLGVKTDASYRFERRVDPNGTLEAIDFAASMIVELAGGTRERPIDVVVAQELPQRIVLRTAKLQEQSAGAVGAGYALDLFRRLGFGAENAAGGIAVTVPTYRGDIHEEMDLVEEVLRFFGLNNVPASLPRLTTGDVRQNPIVEAEDEVRSIAVGCGLSEVINYSFIGAEHNRLFSDEKAVVITNALSENVGAMRLSLIPGLLESVAFNRSYGTRDGALFEVGRTYHRIANERSAESNERNAGSQAVQSSFTVSAPGIEERHGIGLVMFGTVRTHWGDAKPPVDFFDVKGVVEQIAAKFYVQLTFAEADANWLKKGRRAVARHQDRKVATLGFIAHDVLQRFGIKGEVAAAEIDLQALLASTIEWKMAPVARFPGVPMILAVTHGRDLDYQRIVDAIRSLDVPFLHEVGLRDRFVPETDENTIKTTLGMWYQALDRSLTQEEVAEIHHNLASRVAGLVPVRIV
jgi:phenylalanyl-tRNA synthetase beta chain